MDHTLRTDLKVLFLLGFVIVSNEIATSILVPLAANARGASNLWIGILTGMPFLIIVFVLIPGTWLVSSWRRRTALAAGVGLQGAAALGQGIVSDVRWMLVPQMVLGIGLALSWPEYLSYFSATIAHNTANEMHGRRAGVQGIAVLAAPVGATYLAQHFGYQGAFFVLGGLTVLPATLTVFLMSPAAHRVANKPTLSDFINTYYRAAILVTRRAFLIVLGLVVIGTILFSQIGGPFLTLYIRSLGFNDVAVGMFHSARSLSDTTLRFLFGRTTKHVQPIYLLVLAISSGAFFYLLIPVVSTPFLLGGLLLVIGGAHSPRIAAETSILSGVLRGRERELGMALYVMVSSAAYWLAPPLLGALGDAVGLSVIFLVGGSLALGSTIVLAFIGRKTVCWKHAH